MEMLEIARRVFWGRDDGGLGGDERSEVEEDALRRCCLRVLSFSWRAWDDLSELDLRHF